MSPAAIPARACAKGESYQTSAASTNDRIDFCAGPRLIDAQVIIRVRVGRAERGRDARKGLVSREHPRVSRPLHFEQEKPERHRRRRGRALQKLAVRARAAVRALALSIGPPARVPDASVVTALLAQAVVSRPRSPSRSRLCTGTSPASIRPPRSTSVRHLIHSYRERSTGPRCYNRTHDTKTPGRSALYRLSANRADLLRRRILSRLRFHPRRRSSSRWCRGRRTGPGRCNASLHTTPFRPGGSSGLHRRNEATACIPEIDRRLEHHHGSRSSTSSRSPGNPRRCTYSTHYWTRSPRSHGRARPRDERARAL